MNCTIALTTLLVMAGVIPAVAQITYADRDEWWLESEDGCSLYVAEFGRGEPWIVLHGGWGAEHSYLVDAFEWLGSRYHLVFYDQRGSLRSPFQVYKQGAGKTCPDELITVEKHIEDLERLRIELGLDKLNLAAHSMGNFLALSYLKKFPNRVKGLILLAPATLKTADTEEESLLQKQQQEAVKSLFDRPELQALKKQEGLDKKDLSNKEKYHEWRIRFAAVNLYHIDRWKELRGGMAFHNSAAGNAAAKSMPKAYNFLGDLRSHPYPITIIIGDHDFGDLGLKNHKRWVTGIPNVELAVVKDAGHAIWLDQPDEFRVQLERALKKYRSAK